MGLVVREREWWRRNLKLIGGLEHVGLAARVKDMRKERMKERHDRGKWVADPSCVGEDG